MIRSRLLSRIDESIKIDTGRRCALAMLIRCSRWRSVFALFLLAALLAPGRHAQAQEQAQSPDPAAEEPATQPDAQSQPQPEPPPTLVVRDLLVLQCDRYAKFANDPGQLRTTLDQPIVHRGRARQLADRGGYDNSAMPLGLVTFTGKIEAPMHASIEVPESTASFLAYHPGSDAIVHTNKRKIEWQNVHGADEGQRAEKIGRGDHWLQALRDDESLLWIASRDPYRKERFLLYDVTVPYEPALNLKQKDDVFTLHASVKDAQAPAMTFLVRAVGDAWAGEWVQGPWGENPPRLNARPDESALKPHLDELLAPLARLLTERGYSDTEVSLAMQMIGSAMEKSQMSLVYVMPDDQIDNYVALRLEPKPDRLIRTAIVVLNNVDPDMGIYIRKLIAELGSEDWQTRERAHKTLEEQGNAALKPLQEALTNPDPEIAFRARQILNTYDRNKSNP